MNIALRHNVKIIPYSEITSVLTNVVMWPHVSNHYNPRSFEGLQALDSSFATQSCLTVCALVFLINQMGLTMVSISQCCGKGKMKYCL